MRTGDTKVETQSTKGQRAQLCGEECFEVSERESVSLLKLSPPKKKKKKGFIRNGHCLPYLPRRASLFIKRCTSAAVG